jgi:hypothetical protein
MSRRKKKHEEKSRKRRWIKTSLKIRAGSTLIANLSMDDETGFEILKG